MEDSAAAPLCEYFAIDAQGRCVALFTQGAHGQPMAFTVEPCGQCFTVATCARGGAALRLTRRSAPHALQAHLAVLGRVFQECARLLWDTASAAAEAASAASPAALHDSCATAEGSTQGSAAWALELCERLLDCAAAGSLAAAKEEGAGAAAPALRWSPDAAGITTAVLRCWATGSDPLLPAPAPIFSLRPLPPSAAHLPAPLVTAVGSAQRPALLPVLVLTPSYLAMHCDPRPGSEAVGFSWRVVHSPAQQHQLDLYPFALCATGRLAWLRCPAAAQDERSGRVAALLRCSNALPLLTAAAAASGQPRQRPLKDLDESMGEGPHACSWRSLVGSQGGGGLRSAAAMGARLLEVGAAAAAQVLAGQPGSSRVQRLLPFSPWEQEGDSLCSSVAGGVASDTFLFM